MAIVPSQASVGTTIGTLAVVPAGACGVVLYVPGTNTVYVGSGTNLSTASGYPVVGGTAPVHIPVLPAGSQTVLYALASATGTPCGVIVSTDK